MDSLRGHIEARRVPSDGRSSGGSSQPTFASGTNPTVVIPARPPRHASVAGRMRAKDGTALADAVVDDAVSAAGPSKPGRTLKAGRPAQNSFRSNDAAQIFGQGAAPTLGPKAVLKAAPKTAPKASGRPRPKPSASASARRSPEPAVDSSPLEELVTGPPADYKPRSPSPILTDDDEAPATAKSGAAGPSSQRSPRRNRKSGIRIPERSGAPPSSLEEAAEKRRRDQAKIDESRRVVEQLSTDLGIWQSQEGAGARPAVLPNDAEELEQCPWCGGELPDEPSATLLSMLQQLLDYAHEHPGHKISATKTVSMCHRHHDELVTIPDGVAKGWPKQLESAELEARAAELLPEMEMRVSDPTSSEWFVLCKQREEARRGAGHGIEAFSDMQAGYYGELGWITLRNVLTSHFLRSPPSPELDLAQAGARTAPLSAQHFIDAVLLPEMLCSLIQQDCGCSLAEAKALKEESAAYGLAVFPAANDEHQGWGAGEGAFGETATSSQKGPFKRTSRNSRAAELDAPAGSPPKKARGGEFDAAPSPSPATQRPKPRTVASATAQASGSGADAPSQQGTGRPRPRAKATASQPAPEAPEAPSSAQRRPRPRASNSSLDSRGASGSPTKRRMTVMDLDGSHEPSPSPCSAPSRLQPPMADTPPLPSQADSVVFLGSQPERQVATPPPPASQLSLDGSDAEPDDAASAVRACFLRGVPRALHGAAAAANGDSSSELSDADASGEEDVDWDNPP